MKIDDKGGEIVQRYDGFLSFGEREIWRDWTWTWTTWTKREQY
jgi:hypothetical protein